MTKSNTDSKRCQLGAVLGADTSLQQNIIITDVHSAQRVSVRTKGGLAHHCPDGAYHCWVFLQQRLQIILDQRVKGCTDAHHLNMLPF